MKKRSHMFSRFTDAAERKMRDKIPGWEHYSFDVVDDWIGVRVVGAVPVGTYSRGPKKGRPKWGKANDHTIASVLITTEEMDAEAEEFEAAGGCWNCDATGQEFASWSVDSGTKTRACGRCGGSGVAPIE